MKKRIKLFTTIASLCLAVALMAFGVYAATTVNFTASGKIAFSSTEINGSWSLAVAVTNGTGHTAAPTISSNKASVGTVTVTDITKDCVITLTATFTNNSTTKATLEALNITVPETASQDGYTLSGALDSTNSQLAVAAGAGQTGKVIVKFTFKVTDKTTANAGVDYSVNFNAKPNTAA